MRGNGPYTVRWCDRGMYYMLCNPSVPSLAVRLLVARKLFGEVVYEKLMSWGLLNHGTIGLGSLKKQERIGC